VRRKRKSRIKKRKTRVKKRRSRIKKRKAHFKRRRTRVKKRKFINKKTRRKKRRTIQKGGLGFKDLFMALSAITASLSGVGATPMLPRTQVAVDLVRNPNTVFCTTGLHDKELDVRTTPGTTPGSLARSLIVGVHPDKLESHDLTDGEREKRDKQAAIHITNIASIVADLKDKKKEEDNCSTLANAVGPDNYANLIKATDFIKKQHGVEDGDESDDPETTTHSNLPLIGATGAALVGLHALTRQDQKEEEKKLAKAKEAEEKKLAKAKEAEEKKLAKAKEAEAVTSSFKGAEAAKTMKKKKKTPFVYRGNIRDYYR